MTLREIVTWCESRERQMWSLAGSISYYSANSQFFSKPVKYKDCNPVAEEESQERYEKITLAEAIKRGIV